MTIKELYDICTNIIVSLTLKCNTKIKYSTEDEPIPPLADLAFLHAFGKLPVYSFSIWESEVDDGVILEVDVGDVPIGKEQIVYRNYLNMISSEIETEVDRRIEEY